MHNISVCALNSAQLSLIKLHSASASNRENRLTVHLPDPMAWYRHNGNYHRNGPQLYDVQWSNSLLALLWSKIHVPFHIALLIPPHPPHTHSHITSDKRQATGNRKSCERGGSAAAFATRMPCNESSSGRELGAGSLG